ncbi:hypothetical protein [Thalassobellus suaedae]|uniref:Fibronectin type-III domain-containing protein n=1 Tax=Thalassobellus suaedae TaxID=3074124 RepID=A0ABY9Y446_9FLAO|nr:hypothetical protein RHP49_17210 [Flavobacteriaceae bacterium HL-DH10]
MVDLSNFESGQVYYAKAFALNEKGIGYGNEISFTISSINPPIVQIGYTKLVGVHDILLEDKTKEADKKSVN